jgi:Fe-S-cluster containining protein
LCIKREQQYKYDIGVLNLFKKLRNKIAIHVKIGVQYIKLDMVLCIFKKKEQKCAIMMKKLMGCSHLPLYVVSNLYFLLKFIGI